jgi:hypothetical protein
VLGFHSSNVIKFANLQNKTLITEKDDMMKKHTGLLTSLIQKQQC